MRRTTTSNWFPTSNSRRQFDSEEARQALIAARGDGDVSHAAPSLALYGVRVRRREQVVRVQPRGEREHVRRADRGPVDAGSAPVGRLPPVNHQLVGIACEATSGEPLRRARAEVEGLGNPVGRGETRVPGRGNLEIALRQLVVVLRARDHAATVGDGRVGVCDLRHEAVVGPAREPLLDRLAPDDVARIIDVQEAAEEGPDIVLPRRDDDRLVVGAANSVVRRVFAVVRRREEGKGAAVDIPAHIRAHGRRAHRAGRVGHVRGVERDGRCRRVDKVGVVRLRGKQAEEYTHARRCRCPAGRIEADPRDRKVVVRLAHSPRGDGRISGEPSRLARPQEAVQRIGARRVCRRDERGRVRVAELPVDVGDELFDERVGVGHSSRAERRRAPAAPDGRSRRDGEDAQILAQVEEIALVRVDVGKIGIGPAHELDFGGRREGKWLPSAMMVALRERNVSAPAAGKAERELCAVNLTSNGNRIRWALLALAPVSPNS